MHGRRIRLPFAASVAVVAAGAATLPLGAIAHHRSSDFGLSTQSWGSWAGDVAKGDAISIVFAGAGGALLVLLIRRFPRRWWIAGAVAAVALAAVFEFLSPVLLD